MYIFYIIIIFLQLVAIVIAYFLMKKLAKKIAFYEDWYRAFKNRISAAHDMMRAIDIRGSFEADDEVGETFKMMKQIVDDVNKFVQ